MERVYQFTEKQYRYKVVYIGYFLLVLIAFSVYQLLSTGSVFYLAIGLIACYGASNTYMTKSNPREIIVTDDKIIFRSYGEKEFDVKHLERFRVRVSTAGYQVFVRVRDINGKTGRFWVNYALFSEKEDLLKEFDYLERRVHPETLRMRGRKEMGIRRPVIKEVNKQKAII